MKTQNEVFYDPNINIKLGSPDSKTTITADLLDGFEELIQNKIVKY